MLSLDSLLFLIAAICFACDAVGVQTRVNLTALGLFCCVLTVLV